MPESVALFTRRKPKDRKYPVVGRSHIHQKVARLPGGPYYTVLQVAWILEKDPKTVKRWIRQGKTERASKYVRLHGEVVYLYTEADLERLRVFSESQ